MGVKLTWVNRGTALDNIKIYRGTDKAGPFTLVATLDGAATSYEDTTVPTTNMVYWYTVNSVKGSGETASIPTPLGYFPDTGPGPQSLLMGDWEFGYFGEVFADMGLLPTFDEVAAAGGFPRGSDPLTKFRKWVIGGKIIFIPNAVIGYYSMTSMVTYKLVKPYSTDSAPVLSLSKGNYGFKVRLAKASTIVDSGPQVIAGDATKYKSELYAYIACHVNLDIAAEANRYFKGGYRVSDENLAYTGMSRIWCGHNDVGSWWGLQYSQYSIPISTTLATGVSGTVIYELDFS